MHGPNESPEEITIRIYLVVHEAFHKAARGTVPLRRCPRPPNSVPHQPQRWPFLDCSKHAPFKGRGFLELRESRCAPKEAGVLSGYQTEPRVESPGAYRVRLT
jgi:hypothetical protein